MVKQINQSCYQDGNKNRWSKETHTREEADAKSKTLLNCTGCVDCSDCTDSHRCYDSTGLVGCTDLVMSSDSIDCHSCRNVHNARGLHNADDYQGKTYEELNKEMDVLERSWCAAVENYNIVMNNSSGNRRSLQFIPIFSDRAAALKALYELTTKIIKKATELQKEI